MRNYKGENMCREYLLECFKASLENNRTFIDKGKLDLYEKNVMLYWKDKFVSEFNSEYNRKRFHLQDRIAEYYMGIPYGIEYGYGEIDKKRIEWGYVNTKPQRFVEGWWNVLAFRTLQLMTLYEVRYDDLYF